MAYITVKDLEPGYEGQPVTDKINFQVNKGDYLCIVGENGAGKSTLMKTILHLIKPLSGTISYGDGLEEYEIGYLPQQSFVQKDFPASVWEVALSGNLAKLGRRPFYSAAEKKNTRERLEELGIWELRNKCYRDLSGGQQQRVLLARALCATTKLLLLDEPVSGLDPKVTTELYRLIRKLNQSGVTILMVEQNARQSLLIADYAYVLELGRIKSEGTSQELLQDEALISAYLGKKK